MKFAFFIFLNYIKDSNNESLEKLIKQYSQMFDLTAPMKGCVVNQGRYLFLEGDLKFKDNTGKVRYCDKRIIHLITLNFYRFLLNTLSTALQISLQMDVHCFLLTDILLVCKQTAKKGHGNLKVKYLFNF